MSDFLNLNFEEVQEETGFGPLPVGEYTLAVMDAVKKTTRKGDGTYINVKYKVVSPEKYNKRFVWDNVNISNPNKTAMNIGLARLKKMFLLAGVSVAEMKTKTVQDLVGSVYDAFVTHDEFNGKKTERVASLNKHETGLTNSGPTQKDLDDIPF